MHTEDHKENLTRALSRQETLSKYGETSVEAAICYYEYGNALFRAARLEQVGEEDAEAEGASDEARGKAAEAALKRAVQDSLADSKPVAKGDLSATGAKDSEKLEANGDGGGQEEAKESDAANEEEEKESEEEDDVQLALEMMETAWSVLDKHVQERKDENKPLSPWVLEQLPRFLLGIGDVLTDLTRLADAADVYSRALDHRESALEGITKDELTLDHLRKRRMVVEANVLVAEALLACPEGEDVVTTETGDVLVSAGERVEYARGYYNKARDELQETVYLMGRIAASGQDFETEKENVCFISTLLMGVGTTLAEYDEQKAAAEQANALHPSKRQKK